MVSLFQIIQAIQDLDIVDGDKNPVIEQLSYAVDASRDALQSMDSLAVQGRESVDVLLGCMMAMDAVIGEAKNGK